ncbi:primary-amine oxidase [Streptomyces cocklensis]|uniref:Amine oxidase n=1 Tax=Actinacidiphila cocklensis TaxID=887465 RepID=A0A9W4DJB2_9ACTN|nr:primary-amine oxidase [Actinacidiphila cocklensis]MDD1059247.1 primary-amine oxidase [Actinacidiphila cocklensis]WSX73245.1 primary-amine oxidase [Streptomyces sp. NBC_00899]WSX80689.1 primary-amine oxidase [Streptomyces sp. NBC_00899]CAG6392446.1 Histamine oxidase [Actinacidiphila cocklensis]
MTSCPTDAETAPAAAPHPLDPLTAAEIEAARAVLEAEGKVTGTTRFPLVLPDEPDRHAVLAHRPGDPVGRRIRATLLDTATGRSAEALVDVTDATAGVLLSYRDLDPAADGQPPLLFEEYETCDEIVKADAGWRKAMAERGVTDLSLVIAAPLAAGNFGVASEAGRRMLRSLTFLRCTESDNPFAHPVGGLVADVDLTARRVVRLIDTGAVPVPAECGRYDAESTGPARTDLRPLEITQPEGPSFALDGPVLRWQNWRLRLDFNAREGLVLHEITHRDAGRDRPVLHRASIAEMAVPYAEPDPARNWVCYLDSGEYLLGRNANALRLGCDCLGEIAYVDAVLADDHGRPETLPNAICVHEEDIGLLWKHTNIFDGLSVDSRRARRLVISYIATLGNYDYGFYWYLHQDGTIAFEAKATGLLQTSAGQPGDGSPYATEVAPGLLAPFHQHLFCARLDVTVDGPGNTVEEVDVVRLPTGPDNPNGNAFTTRATPVADSGQAGRVADPSVGRRWRIVNPGARNRMGAPVAYTLVPDSGPLLLAQPGSSVAERVAYATRHLWVTRYRPERRYPDGDYPNQHAGGAGVAAWSQPGEALEDTDLTVWHSFGPTHLPRLEDWPVMPVDVCGFSLRPTGFFDRNPALDLPKETGGASGGHCHA